MPLHESLSRVCRKEDIFHNACFVVIRSRLPRRVTREVIAWPAAAGAPADATFQLHHSTAAGIRMKDGNVGGADGALKLSQEPTGLPRSVRRK